MNRHYFNRRMLTMLALTLSADRVPNADLASCLAMVESRLMRSRADVSWVELNQAQALYCGEAVMKWRQYLVQQLAAQPLELAQLLMACYRHLPA